MVIDKLPVLYSWDPPGVHSIEDLRIGFHEGLQLLPKRIKFLQMSFSLHNLEIIKFKLPIARRIWESGWEWLSIQLKIELASATACVHILESRMFMNTFVFDSNAQFKHTVFSKESMTVTCKTCLSPIVIKEVFSLLFKPVKHSFWSISPLESFRIEDQSKMIFIGCNLIKIVILFPIVY